MWSSARATSRSPSRSARLPINPHRWELDTGDDGYPALVGWALAERARAEAAERERPRVTLVDGRPNEVCVWSGDPPHEHYYAPASSYREAVARAERAEAIAAAGRRLRIAETAWREYGETEDDITVACAALRALGVEP